MDRPPMADLMKTIKLLLLQRFHRAKRFIVSVKRSDSPKKGITLLLVILILSALLSVSITIFDSVLGQLRISGEITDSFIALYAADQGLEGLLYENRVAGTVCPESLEQCEYGPVTFGPGYSLLPQDACFRVSLEKEGNEVKIISTGEYRCSSPSLSVKRAFSASYQTE